MRKPDSAFRILYGKSIPKFPFVSVVEETWHPLTDVFETNSEMIVKMELPGVEIKDIQIILQNKRLIVQGLRRDPCKGEKISYQRMEISYGFFRRIVLLPVAVRTKESKAAYKHGFHEIRLPFSDVPSVESMVINIE